MGTGPQPHAAPPESPISRLDQLSDELNGLSAQENANHYRMGQIHNFIRDKKLPEKAVYLLRTYKEAAGIQVNYEEPGETPIEVPDEKGNVSMLPFKDCTVDQMRKALQRKRKPTSSKPLPPEVEARADEYREAVLARFPKGKGTRVKVGLRNETGSGVLDFTGIPVDQVKQLREALQSLEPS